MVSIVLFSIFLNLVTCFALAVFLLIARVKYKYFIIFNSNLVIWNLFYILAIIADTADRSLLYYQIHYASTVFIPYLAFNFALEFSGYQVSKKIKILNLLAAVIFAVLMFTDLGVKAVRPLLEFRFAPDSSWAYHLWVIYYAIFITYTHVILYKNIKGDKRNLFMFIGYITGFVGGSTNLFFYLGIPVYQWGNFLVSVYGCLITYAIIKHRLFDASVIINEGLARFLAVGTLGVLYFILEYFYHFLIPQSTLFTDNLFNLSFILVALELYRFLVKKFQTTYRWEILLKKVNQKLVNVAEFVQLYGGLEEIFEKEVRAQIKVFVVFGEDGKLELFGQGIDKVIPDISIEEIKKLTFPITKNDAPLGLKNIFNDREVSSLIPFVTDSKVSGFMLVSKQSSKNFSYNDLMLFDNLSFQIGVLIDRIKAYQEISARKIDHEISLQKQKALQEKTLALKSLAGSIAHEMRNPLNAVNLSLHEISDAVLKNDLEKLSEYKEVSHSSIRRANQVIDMILAELREQNVEVKNLENFSVKKIIDKAASEYGYDSKAEKQRVKLDIRDDFLVKVEENLLVFVLFNLMKNALYYPGSELIISASKGDKQNFITVHDFGPGIAKEKLAILFKDFSTFDKQGGTGLGLSFCKRTMQAFGGDIAVDSEVGKYTKFILSFPKIIGEEQVKIDSKVISNICFKDKKILLADDQALNRKLTGRYLESFGAKLDHATNGSEALEKAKENQYDLILMDIEMPVMNGICAVKEIRIHKVITPVIAITGDVCPTRIEEILESGFTDYFIKGGDPEMLIAILVKNLSGEKS